MQNFAVRFLATLLALSLASLASAQISRDDFRAEFNKGLEYEDQKMMDKAMRKQGCASHAALFFEELHIQTWSGNADNRAECEALRASWGRCFDGSGTLDKLQRWIDTMELSNYRKLERGRQDAIRVWNGHVNMPKPTREELLLAMDQFLQLAENAKSLGHMIEAAENWNLAAVVGGKIARSEKTIEDREKILDACEKFLRARDSWEFTHDTYYGSSKAFVTDESVRIKEDAKKQAGRKDEGYEEDAKGADTLVMPDVAEAKYALEFAPLKDFSKDLDYGPKNGLAPVLWWMAQTDGSGTAKQIAWFQREAIYLARTGGAKFAISLSSNDLSETMPIHVGGRPKTSTFYIDKGKNVPYSMWFWSGSDSEPVGVAQCNLAFTKDFAVVYYRSAASWKTKVGKESLVFYDDNANGQFLDADPWKMDFKIKSLGDQVNGTPAPLLDSMRIGKKRMPFSEFVKLKDGWFHMRKHSGPTGDEVGVRPLNPKYFQTGKVKLSWSGAKATAPKQLVIQGKGTYRTAFFELAGGKEVEVPIGDYEVIFGRVVVGKGARVKNATLYGGESKPFSVEKGKTTELKMGAPFQVQWTRRGDKNVSIDALKIMVRESSGCFFTDLHGAPLAPEVLVSKNEDGKGGKPEGSEFAQFTDGYLVTEASKHHAGLGTHVALFPMPRGYTKGPLNMTVTLREEGLKMGLYQKKHAIFGELLPLWQ